MNFYNTIASDWDRTRRNAWGEFGFLKPLLPAGIPPNPPQPTFSQGGRFRVLDAGCGNGRLVPWLRENGYAGDYLGVDLSEELLKIAGKNFPEEEFLQANITEFKEPAGFDLIISIAVLHHLENKEARLAALKNFYESLQPGGKVFLTVWNLWQRRYRRFILKQFSRNCRIPFSDKGERLVHAFTKGELRRLLWIAGFRKIKIFYAAGDKRARIFNARNLVAIAER